jgi:hypothetical protein
MSWARLDGSSRGPLLALGASLLAAVLCFGFLAFSKYLYFDVDGGLALTQIGNFPAGTPVWNQSQIFPLQGMGTQRLPGNPLINPGFAILANSRTLARVVGSYLFFALSVFAAVLVLGRALGVGLPAAVLAGQAAALLPFPPLEQLAGLPPQLQLNPGVAYYIAIAVVLVAIAVRVGTTTAARNAALIVALPALFLYGVLCDPLWTVVPCLSLSVFVAAAFLIERTRRTLAWRAAGLLFGLAALAALSVPAYLAVLMKYTARGLFRGEIVGEVQDLYYTFLPFQNYRTGALFLLLLAGVVLALRDPGERVRVFAGACLAHMGALTAMTGVYLLTDINWTFPLPAYFQQSALPVYLLVAAAGWRRGLGILRERLPARGARALRRLGAPAVAVCLVPAVAAAAIGSHALLERTKIGNLGDNFDDRNKLNHPFFKILYDTLALAPDRPFRGCAAMLLTKDSGTVISALQSRLWMMGIPTLEEYSQLVSPQFYYAVTRGLGQPDDGSSGRNRVRVTVPRVPLLRAMGVRFVLTAAANAPLFRDVPACRLVPGRDAHLLLYELAQPNIGNYSPTLTMVSRSAQETVSLLTASWFDPEQQVVLTELPGGALVPASSASLRFVDGGVRVTATSPGRSLLVLPLQYSHALRLRADAAGARLMRANLAQTALVFDRRVDAFITLEFGFGRVAGRERDLADTAALGIREDGSRTVGPEALADLHPYQRFRLFGP